MWVKFILVSKDITMATCSHVIKVDEIFVSRNLQNVGFFHRLSTPVGNNKIPHKLPNLSAVAMSPSVTIRPTPLCEWLGNADLEYTLRCQSSLCASHATESMKP